jgi:hypothetical protein
LFTAKNDEELQMKINCTLDYKIGWFWANGLALNMKKRNIMKFTSQVITGMKPSKLYTKNI